VILVSIIVAIMGIFAISLWKNHEHAQKVEAIKHDVMTELEKGPLPWDSVFKNMYDTDFDATNEAFDELRAEGRLKFNWLSMDDGSGRKYDVKVYSLISKGP
jgi:hypothetical protein